MTVAHFRRSVESLGYQVGDRSKHGNFEAAGIPRDTIMAFSTRRQQILDQVATMAARTPEVLHSATLMTRTDKTQIADPSKLKAGWKKTAASIGLDLDSVRAAANARAPFQPGLAWRIGDVVALVAEKARDLAFRCRKGCARLQAAHPDR